MLLLKLWTKDENLEFLRGVKVSLIAVDEYTAYRNGDMTSGLNIVVSVR